MLPGNSGFSFGQIRKTINNCSPHYWFNNWPITASCSNHISWVWCCRDWRRWHRPRWNPICFSSCGPSRRRWTAWV